MAAVSSPVILLDAVFVKLYTSHYLALLDFARTDGFREHSCRLIPLFHLLLQFKLHLFLFMDFICRERHLSLV